MKEAIKLVAKEREIPKKEVKGCFEVIETGRNIHDWRT